ERSFTKERRQLDPWNQLRCEAWCQHGREAIDEVGQAVDRQQDSDGSGNELRLVHQVRHEEDVEAKEDGVDVVIDRRKVARQVGKRLQLSRRKSIRIGSAAQKGQRCELVDDARS